LDAGLGVALGAVVVVGAAVRIVGAGEVCVTLVGRIFPGDLRRTLGDLARTGENPGISGDGVMIETVAAGGDDGRKKTNTATTMAMSPKAVRISVE